MPPRRQQDRSTASISLALKSALKLFSSQGFGATTMRHIGDQAGMSMGNLYHHFPNKEAIFRHLLADYWAKLEDPEHPLQRLFARANFPDDLEEMAVTIEEVVEQNSEYILLIYVDVVEFGGENIRSFYEGMATRFQEAYGEKLAARQAAGEIGEVDPLIGVILAARWFFYFFTVEKCFGVPMHLGMSPRQATEEFIRLLRYGLLPRTAAVQRGDVEKTTSDVDPTPTSSDVTGDPL